MNTSGSKGEREREPSAFDKAITAIIPKFTEKALAQFIH